MKLVTWNVNGLRSVFGKGFGAYLHEEDPDVVLLQETKVKLPELDWDGLEKWHRYWNPAKKPGYSGTAILSKAEPLAVSYGMGLPAHDGEGRVVTAEFAQSYVVCVYTPNAQEALARLPYRLEWDAAFSSYLQGLAKVKPVLCAGDFNVAHEKIDIARPDSNHKSPGFSDEERASFSKLLSAGFTDVFREFDKGPDKYTWWSYRAGARARNVGWRLDYWLSSAALRPRLRDCVIRAEVLGSDHCPVVLEVAGEL